ncbi:galactose mutarotase-like domain-containing protein [Aspergillus avenaceus]|uniref:Galactose mutarotase-like domain-containing protein n=1 Tax=Aspergillus avenaceus TaxID=36643 RepID=A0A5N6U7E8_ASPAV|nr:galactose mutarotase-like domain-containing protein [Aspergillus avenaceus]
MKLFKVATAFFAAVKSVWTRGNPFAALTALWPTNEEGKYVIQAEGIRLAFTNHGAALTNLWINDTRGEELDIVLGLDDPNGYPKMSSNPWLNGVIGRYAGYMSGPSYQVDDTLYNVTGNAHNGTALFNGGDAGWGRQTWDIAAHIDNSITFVLFDRMWNGFPGVFASCLTHTVTPYQWRIAFGVTPLRRHGPINLSQQAFFNLDGFRANNSTQTIFEHTLHLPSAGLRFAVDEFGIPTGDLLSNKKGQEHDFWSSGRRIGTAGYDETLHLSHKQHANKEDSPVAILSSAHSGITMKLFTDQDALHVHTWDRQHGALQLKKGQGDGDVPQYGAVSLDITDWPDGVNHPEWRNRQTLWGMDGLYTSFVTYEFSVNGQEQEKNRI